MREERFSSFEEAYAKSKAPWDIGRPQPEMVALERAGRFGLRVLDVGCGTGELALHMAEHGHDVVGIDSAEIAIERAQTKAAERGLEVDFRVADVLEALPAMLDEFDAVVDVGFFHVLSDEARITFADGLASALVPGGVYAMLCFSDRQPGETGPRRVSEAEIRATFAGERFEVLEVRPAGLHTLLDDTPVIDGNLALIERA